MPIIGILTGGVRPPHTAAWPVFSIDKLVQYVASLMWRDGSPNIYWSDVCIACKYLGVEHFPVTQRVLGFLAKTPLTVVSVAQEITPAEYLRRVRENCFEEFGPDFWVESLFARIRTLQLGDALVIDLKPEEVAAFRAQGGEV